MAPRRHGSGHGGGLLESSVFQQQHLSSSSVHQLDLDLSHVLGAAGASLHCCTPGECFRGDTPVRAWSLQDSVKVVCSNDNCTAGQFMHRECFEVWEQTLLTYLKTCGRARSWSERQRHQNLWTKKGYDLVHKACGCKCGRGNLKKDLDWASPLGQQQPVPAENPGEAKKKKRRNRQNAKPSLTVSSGNPQQMINAQQQHILGAGDSRGRAGSLSSSTGSSSPPATASETSVSPLHQPQPLFKRKAKLEVCGGIR